MANEKIERVKLISPPGRLCFPAVFEKERPMEGDSPDKKQKYAATILFDKEYLKKTPAEMARYTAIKTEANRVCLAKFKKPLADATKLIPRFWNPFRDGSEKEHLDGYGSGVVFFKASSQRRIGVVGPDKKTPITDPEALYAGCYVRFTVSPYAFDNKMKGVGIGLNSIMFLRDGEHLDGGSNPEEDFGEIESAEDDFGAADSPDADEFL